MKPEISVIMPVYNREKLVRKAIESILNQTFSNFEFIIVDDCSTDDTVAVIKSYNDDRIILLENATKQNVPTLRNQGMAIAQGKYLATMDSDDISLPNRLEEQKRFLDENLDYGLLGTAIYTGREFDEELSLVEKPTGDDKLKYFTAFRACFVNPTTMMRKSVLDEHGIRFREDYFVAEDYALQVDMIPYTKFENLTEPYLNYFFHKDNITNSTIRDPEIRKQRQEVIDTITRTAIKNLELNLSAEEENIFVAYTGEGNKKLPPYEQFEGFKLLCQELETKYGNRFGTDNMKNIHTEMFEVIEMRYQRQSGSL